LIYRAKIEVFDREGNYKEDVSFLESDFIGEKRKILRIPKDNWIYYNLSSQPTYEVGEKGIFFLDNCINLQYNFLQYGEIDK
jgi:hypothetical protein